MSALRIWEGLAGPGSVGVWRLWLPDVSDGRDHFSGHADVVGDVVSRYVVGDDLEERRQRLGFATRARVEELRDGMDVAA